MQFLELVYFFHVFFNAIKLKNKICAKSIIFSICYGEKYNTRKNQFIFTKTEKQIDTKSFKIKQDQTIHIAYFFQDLTPSSHFVEILRKVPLQEQEEEEQQQQQSHS